MGLNSLTKLLGSPPTVKQPLFTQRPKKCFMVRRLQWLLLLLYVPDKEDGLLSSVACIVSAGDDCHGGHDSSRLSCCQLPKISSTEQALMLFMIILNPSFSITIYKLRQSSSPGKTYSVIWTLPWLSWQSSECARGYKQSLRWHRITEKQNWQ